MKEIHRHWPLIGRCIRKQRNRSCPRPDLASWKMGRDALKFTGQERSYEAKRPHMAPYGSIPSECLRMSEDVSGVSQSQPQFGYFGISEVNSWVKPQNQLAMTSQGADQPRCQVEEKHSQEASQGASEAGQKDLPWATVWKMFEMECKNSAVNSWFLAYSNMFKCSHQDPLTIRELQWVTFCTLDWRFDRHQHAQIPANSCEGGCDWDLWDSRPRHARQCDPSWSSQGSGADSVPELRSCSETWIILNHCYNLLQFVLWLAMKLDGPDGHTLANANHSQYG